MLHIAPGFLYGGIESRLIDWYKYIMPNGNVHMDVLKVTPNEYNPLVKMIQNYGGQVFSIPPLGVKTFFQHKKNIRKIISEGNYDVIHSHSLKYGYYALKLARKKGIKTRILHSRSVSENPEEKNLIIKNYFAKEAIKYGTNYFACSDEAGRAAFGEKIGFEVIKNGIVLDNYRYNEGTRCALREKLNAENRFIIGAVGRMSRVKNISFLLKIIIKLKQKKPDILLVIVGGGDDDNNYENHLKKFVKENNLSNNVLFVGRQNNVEEWMQAFDVFISSSFSEGFGTVAIEAQASGLPCVISTGFPPSVDICPNVFRISLTKENEWCDTIQRCYNLTRDRSYNNIRIIRAAGYDAKEVALNIERFYINSVRL